MHKHNLYMACLDLAGRDCLVVGGGPIGAEKAAGLLAAGARVRVVSPRLDGAFAQLEVEWIERGYRRGDLRGMFLVIAATSTPEVNERVHRDAEARRMLCNVADVPELCNFILPAIHRQGPITVAVSTGGASPALAKRLRSEVASLVGPEHAELALELEALRPEAKRRFRTYAERRDYFDALVAERLGVTVYLVGAGPGDPGLITVRGLELLRGCDAVVYDVLVAPELLDEVPAGALAIPREGMGQDELNALLVTLGRQGLDTVRLKGGDPFVFGRGSEEALVLREAGIPVEVVAGVSALSSVPGAAGVPITHRGVSAQVTVVSGHSASDAHLDYAQLAAAPGTLVVFMGLSHLAELAAGLVAAGRDPSTPAAVISQGTTARQETVSGALWEIGELAASLASPALLVVGEVVDLAQALAAHARSGEVTGGVQPLSALR